MSSATVTIESPILEAEIVETTPSPSTELTLNRQRFIRYYSDFNSPTCGNGKQSYLAAFPDVTDESAGVLASKLLKLPEIQEILQANLAAQGFNDLAVDKELLYVVKQNIELSPKLAAIREYNRLTKRVTADKGPNIMIGLSLTQIFDEAQKGQEHRTERKDFDIDLNSVE